MNIYTKEGWIDAPHIEEIADRNNLSFIVIIGKRQVGKTFGVLKLMLDEDKRFILLRGMKTEMEVVKKKSPFKKIPDYKDAIEIEPDTDYTSNIVRYDANEDGTETKVNIGMLAALSSIARIRGFDGDDYTDVVYDEFIPEEHLLKVRHGGDAFNNMYVTVSGNREIEGRPPLRVWLLANSNNLDNDILKALHITDVVERMSLRGEESRMLKERGILILLPDSTKIIEKRSKSALYRAIGSDSKFSRMSLKNEFAYNDYTDVDNKPLKEYKPLIRVADTIVHLHKDNKTLYITGNYKCQPKHQYPDTEYGRMTFVKDYPEIKAAYLRGRITFQNMTVKNSFLDYIDIL